MASFLEFISER